MKKSLLIIFILLNCNLFSQQKDSLAIEFSDKIQVFKNLISKKYFIKKENKTVFGEIKYVQNLFGMYLQILDKNNTVFYLNTKGKKDTNLKINLGLCGTVPNYTYKVEESDKQFILTSNETFYDYGDKIPAIKIDSINKLQADKIYFSNNLNSISFTENDFIFSFTKTFPYALIVEKGNSKGILWNTKLSFYDEVIYDSQGIFKIKIDGKYGYFNITEINYKEIESFHYGLARFKTIDGKMGYVDINGKEYFD